MRFKARRMNAYLYASNLAHIPAQLAWGAAKRGITATSVKSAYSSQECQRCHFVAQSNRPEQQTFCCRVCGWQMHADHNAAVNLAARLSDREIQATKRGRSSRRSWTRAISDGGKKPVGHSPTAPQLLVQRA